jgi:hypothetical protein
MDFSDLINGRANAWYTTAFDKSAGTTLGTNNIYSTYKHTGYPAIGTNPTTTFATCTSSTTGALRLPSLGSGAYYVDRLSLVLKDTYAQRYAVVDRLAHVGGYVGNSTSLQSFAINVSGVSADRLGASDYTDLQWFLEGYTAIGATPTTITVTYTNGAGTGSRTTTVTTTDALAAGELLRIVGSGGESIQSVQSLQLSPSSGTAGNFGITAYREIFATTGVPLNSTAQPKNWAQTSLAKIQSDAFVQFITYAQASNGTIEGRFHLFSSTAA